ncbi:MAG TPA: class I SAM-dependent methyltransferase [Candidatus Angelobacter sp.]|jgi:ubiquinone/menaquinone biosynthesis C-methylase UbiE
MVERKNERLTEAATAAMSQSTQLGVLEEEEGLDQFLISQFDDVPYLLEHSLGNYLRYCRKAFPLLYDCLDLSRLSGNSLRHLLTELESISPHFESEAQGGRGNTYRNAQNRNPVFRARGIKKLFELAKPEGCQFSPSDVVLDAIGGNGTFTRALNLLELCGQIPTIFTADASAMMISDALAQSLPAIRQPAQLMLLRDNSADGVVFAYGTHHISPSTRAMAFREAHRVLKRFRKVVIQDFEEGSPTARWYSEVLDRYTTTGHKFQHFTREGLRQLVLEAGFSDVQIIEIYDPFVFHGNEPETARRRLVEHACSLFGLEKLIRDDSGKERHWRDIEALLHPYGVLPSTALFAEAGIALEPSVIQEDHGYTAEFPRIALVALAVKK